MQRQRASLKRERDRLVAGIEKAEARIAEINETFADPGYYESTAHEAVMALQSELKQAENRLEDAMSEWQSAEDALAMLG